MPSSTRRASARSRITVSAAILGAATLALAGCAGGGASGADSGDGPKIVATTTQVGDFTREVLGEGAEFEQLLQPGASAHSFDPSAAQLSALAAADALVINGAGLEEWLDDAIEASGFDGLLIDASEGIHLEGTHEHEGEETHAEDEHDHAEGEEHAEGEHDHAEGEHDHEHAEGNPHIWTSTANAEAMVHSIAHGLAEVEGVDAEAVEANEEAYLAKLGALDAWITENVDPVPADQRLLVSNHDAFTYFVDEYGITFVGSIIPSFDDNAEPSAAEIDQLVADIRETGVKAVFSESSISPKAAETIASEAGVAVYSGEDSLYADSLGVAGSDGATYLGSQVHNVRLILESWGVEASALPAALEE
ncbi:metal ABC transporter substrate-binding protein [Agromyces sp. LHK192]|uniref:metal ABC transporter substrate-binding protein n=1 Tax=Agromyces sp. LHK192 TaxID=2498704 RepID=UPI000FD94981|nr:metal ABC transporter substrate-binding protein [Agromyces sp. LHK192]